MEIKERKIEKEAVILKYEGFIVRRIRRTYEKELNPEEREILHQEEVEDAI